MHFLDTVVYKGNSFKEIGIHLIPKFILNQQQPNPTNYYSLGGTDLLDPQNVFISRANGDWNMSGFPSGSVILALSDTLENASEKEAPSTAPVSPVKLVTEASEGEISLIDPLDSHNSRFGVLSINKMNYS